MKKARKDVHIGSEIERVVREKGMEVTEFARRICCHRKNAYDIFKRKSLDIDHLIFISEVLEYDFIQECYYDGDVGRKLEFRLLLEGDRLTVCECEK